MTRKTETVGAEVIKSAIPAVRSVVNVSRARAVTNVDYGKYGFQLNTLDQKSIALSDFGGRVVLVNFWAPWCPPCKLETPGFVRIYEKYKDTGFAMIGIAVSTNERQVQNFLKDYKVTYPVGVESDSDISDRYGVFGIPASFLFAPDGSLYQKFEGYTNEQTLEGKLQELLNRNQ